MESSTGTKSLTERSRVLILKSKARIEESIATLEQLETLKQITRERIQASMRRLRS